MVNTFIVGDIPFTVDVLDAQRRFKQAVEVKEILLTIERKKADPFAKIGFKNHPIVVMWEDHVVYLKHYFNQIHARLKRDGVKMLKLQKYDIDDEQLVRPWFMDYMPLIYSHRARLYQKDPVHYGSRFDFPDVYLRIGYIWIRRERSYYEENVNSPELLADALDAQYVSPRYCDAVCASGSKKGGICGRILKTKVIGTRCGVHTKTVHTDKQKTTHSPCEELLKSGKRKGEMCGARSICDGKCKRHCL